MPLAIIRFSPIFIWVSSRLFIISYNNSYPFMQTHVHHICTRRRAVMAKLTVSMIVPISMRQQRHSSYLASRLTNERAYIVCLPDCYCLEMSHSTMPEMNLRRSVYDYHFCIFRLANDSSFFSQNRMQPSANYVQSCMKLTKIN